MQRDEYLPSIDGLRAVAVLAVIAYHLQATLLPGGFVGVDVFFVISGFIVARSVADAGNRSSSFFGFLGWFYKRRIVRIVPALLLYVVVTSALVALLIPIVEPTRFIVPTGIAALFGASNLFIEAKLSNYFATASEFNPFTHTWSLGVEEQYYFVFPFFSYLLLIASGGKPWLKRAALATLITACVASLVLCWLTTRSNQSFAFFMLPTRFWELGLGFLTYYGLSRWSPGSAASASGNALFSVGGAGLLVALWTTKQAAFPFPGALLPCAATAAIIVSLWKLKAPIGSALLGWRPVNYIGRISYSLYLWHWGTIVFARWFLGDLNALQYVLVIAIMFGLAAGSYHFVETPIRRSSRIVQLPPIKTAAAAAFTLAAAGGLCGGLWIFRPAISLSATRDQATWSPKSVPVGGRCAVDRVVGEHLGGTTIDYRPRGCGDAIRTIWAIGDSHAGAYERAFHRLASDGYSVHLMTLGGCRLVSSSSDSVPNCAAFKRYALDRALKSARAGDVVFAPALLTPRKRDSWGTSTPSPTPRFDVDELYETSFRPLAEKGFSIILEGPKPLIPSAAFRCADWYTRENSYCRDGLSTDRTTVKSSAAPAEAALTQLAARSPSIAVWSPLDSLCQGSRCPAALEGKPLYYDTDHLTAYGNDVLYPSLRSALTGSAPSTLAPQRVAITSQ